MTKLNSAVGLLDMSLMAAKHVLRDSPEPLQRRLAWLGGELERLAGEAYRLADEAGDGPGGPTDTDERWPGLWCKCRGSEHDTDCRFAKEGSHPKSGPLPGFDQ